MRRPTLFLATGLLATAVLFSVASLPALGAAPASSAAPGSSAPRLHLHWLAGQVTAVGSSTLTVGVLWTGPNDGSFNGQTLTVAVTDHTRVNGPHHRPIALADISNGDLVAVRAAGDDPSSLTAVKIRQFCNCHWVGGTIDSVGPSSSSPQSFTVDVRRTGPYDTVLNGHQITLQVNAGTVYLRGHHGARIGFDDLKPGEGVGVVFGANGFFKAPGFDPTTATFTASRVHVWARRQVPPPSSDASEAAGVSAD